MSDVIESGIFFIVEFSWPKPFEPEHGRAAYALHEALVAADWIEEVMAGSGGIGGDLPSMWIFKMGGYADLNRLLKDQDEPVQQAYMRFINQMAEVRDCVREEVVFIPRSEG